MSNQKIILNPWTKKLQWITNSDVLADKNHNHAISDIQGLTTILTSLTNNEIINLKGGYFAN